MAAPIALLKTRSAPTDAYAAHLADFAATFIPVFQHTFCAAGTTSLAAVLQDLHPRGQYGGLIVTSQRTVDALASVLSTLPAPPDLAAMPIYSVGPATTRALAALPIPTTVSGDHTGNGAALAQHILKHYCALHPDPAHRPALLFLTGRVRRDVIPRTLTGAPSETRVAVDELVVYDTEPLPAFPAAFSQWWEATQDAPQRVVVVFSPSGCDVVLTQMGLLGTGEGSMQARRDAHTKVITIGPTTREFLVEKFGFEPNASARQPTPEMVREAILGVLKA